MTADKILIIDDEPNIRDIFSLLLKERGFVVETASTGQEGINKALKLAPDLIVLDVHLPDISGLHVLSRVKAAHPRTQVLIVTAFGTIRNAVEATQMGADDYLEKPVDNEEFLHVVERALEVKRLREEVESLKVELTNRKQPPDIIGRSARMAAVLDLVGKVARTDGTVLITGESGTGKELVARAIHDHSLRQNRPFVVVNCGAIPKDLIESEFFGHVKGAFTDAKEERTGKFELAHKGTIFLDEVAELSPEAQVKLLRALGEKEIVKVGGSRTIPVDVRVIAATNKDLERLVKAGSFREDLFFRLAVLSLSLPPVRERPEDIRALAEHFVARFQGELNKKVVGLADETVECLEAYPWPGNVRELENVIYESMVMCQGQWIEPQDLPPRLRREEVASGVEAGSLKMISRRAVARLEKGLIERALQEARGNKTLAAQKLGVSRKTLFNKMKLLKI